jgi:hypothetical protein
VKREQTVVFWEFNIDILGPGMKCSKNAEKLARYCRNGSGRSKGLRCLPQR